MKIYPLCMFLSGGFFFTSFLNSIAGVSGYGVLKSSSSITPQSGTASEEEDFRSFSTVFTSQVKTAIDNHMNEEIQVNEEETFLQEQETVLEMNEEIQEQETVLEMNEEIQEQQRQAQALQQQMTELESLSTTVTHKEEQTILEAESRDRVSAMKEGESQEEADAVKQREKMGEKEVEQLQELIKVQMGETEAER